MIQHISNDVHNEHVHKIELLFLKKKKHFHIVLSQKSVNLLNDVEKNGNVNVYVKLIRVKRANLP